MRRRSPRTSAIRIHWWSRSFRRWGAMFSIDHLGIAVKSLETAKKFYEGLGMSIMPEEEVAAERVKLAMVPVGESRIELLEPTSDDSPIARFLAKRGEGLHHVALSVPDIAASVDRLKRDG